MADEWLIAFHTVVLAEAAGAIALKLEELHIVTEHEADERHVAIHALVPSEAPGSICLQI